MKKLVVCLLVIISVFAAVIPAAATAEQTITTAQTTVATSSGLIADETTSAVALPNETASENTTEETAASAEDTTVAATEAVVVPDSTSVATVTDDKAAETGKEEKKEKEGSDVPMIIIAYIWLFLLTVALGVITFMVFDQFKKMNGAMKARTNAANGKNSRSNAAQPPISQAKAKNNKKARKHVEDNYEDFSSSYGNPQLTPFDDDNNGFGAPGYYGNNMNGSIYSNRVSTPTYGGGTIQTGAEVPPVAPAPVVKKSFMESAEEIILASYNNGTKFSFAHKYVEVNEEETNINGKTTLTEKSDDKAKYVVFDDPDTRKTYLLPNPIYYNNKGRRFSLAGLTYGQCIATNGTEGGRIDSYQPAEVQKTASNIYQIVKIGKIVWR